MNYNQFSNLSCCEEFEIQCTLTGISKIDVLKEIGCRINNYYFFISNDGIFNWYDLKGNHVKDPGILKKIKNEHIPSNITKCVIPDSVTSIGEDAFGYCFSLTSITIPNSVKSVGSYAFYNCKSLKSITIPDSVKSIGYWAFFYCESLTTVIIPDNTTTISNLVFYGCDSLKQVIFKGKTLKKIKKMKNYPFGIENESIIKCEI